MRREKEKKKETRGSPFLIIIRWKSDLTFSITDKLAIRVQREMKSRHTNRLWMCDVFLDYGLLTVHYDLLRKRWKRAHIYVE